MNQCGGACQNSLDFDFTMAFQAVVDTSARHIHTYEALVRGMNGESAATVLSWITPENRYAFDQACRTRAIELAAAHTIDCRLNINFLPNAVYHPEACLKATLAAAEKYGFPPERITFEFTEDEQIVDRSHLKNIVTTYRRYGFKTALDDFGTGYAGLGLLADFQPDILKIDRSLISGIHTDRPRQAIVAGLMVTCEKLGITVVAEGVEQIEEWSLLDQMGVRLFQGYLFSRPQIDYLVNRSEIVFPPIPNL